MPKSIFEHAKSVCTDKTPWKFLPEEDQKSWNVFMVNRILSMNTDYLELVDMVQMHSNMPPEAVYKLYCEMLPKGYRFIPFLKKGGNSDAIKAVAKEYNISKREAREYVKMLPEEEIAELVSEFTKEPYESKKIKKTKK